MKQSSRNKKKYREIFQQKQKVVEKIGHPESSKQKRVKTFRVPGYK